MFFFDCLLMVVSVVMGIGVGPGTVFGNWFAVGIGFLAMARVLYANFALPKPTAVPRRNISRLENTLVLIGATVVGMCVSLVLMVVLYESADPQLRPLIGLLAPLPFAFFTAMVRTGLLAVMGLLFIRRPEIGDALSTD